MISLTLGSLRHRVSSLTASFLSAFLGAWIIMTFAALLDVAQGSGVAAADRTSLTVMAVIVGGWGLVIVVFAVLSTMTLSVRRRSRETALLKSLGATPAQLTRMIVAEAIAVAVAAGTLATSPAALSGQTLLKMLVSGHRVAPGTAFRFGPYALGFGFGVTLTACVVAGIVAARRGTRVSAAEAMVESTVGARRMSRKRIVFGLLFLGLGLDLGVLTATLMHGKGIDAMQTAGQADLMAAIGLAILAPGLVRGMTAVAAGPLRRFGVSGHLAIQSLRGRTTEAASALMPIILFAGMAIGTLYMQQVENAATAASGLPKTDDQKGVETLNLTVVGMIVVFAAILVINTLIAATAQRRREFGGQRLLGATPRQVLGAVALENLVLAVGGLVLGALAALVTILPYSYARTDKFFPVDQPLIEWGIVAVGLAITLAAGLGTARLAVRTPAVAAVTAV